MQHAQKNRTLGRTKGQRGALLRGLAISLITKGQITTTAAKAKELRPLAERLITYGKRNTVAARRQAASALGEPNDAIIKKLFDEIAPSYQERQGGYTRIVKLGRLNDKDQAVIELVK